MQGLLKDVAEAKGGEIYSVSPSVLVSDAVHQMHEHNVGALLVREGDRIAGIFTERDVLFRVVDDGVDPKATPVSQVMTKDPVSVSPSTSVEDAMRQVTERRIRHLPVVENDRLVAMVSSGDLTRWMVRTQETQIDSLTKDVKSVAAKNKALIVLVALFAVLIVVGVVTN